MLYEGNILCGNVFGRRLPVSQFGVSFMRNLLVTLLVVCVGLGNGKLLSGETGAEERIFPSMHAQARIYIPVDSDSSISAAQAADAAETAIRKANALFSPKGEQSDVYRINNARPDEWVVVDPLTIRIVLEALRWNKLTGGVFEPTIGPVKKLFRFNGKELAKWPGDAELAEARRVVGMDKLRIDPTGCRISRSVGGMTLDLGAIAKGFAADLAAEALAANGVRNAIVDVGGEMRVLGRKPATGGDAFSPWSIGITDPRGGAARVAIDVADRAIASSGDYESYFEYEGRRYSHIIDPRSGLPLAGGVAGVTVSHPASCAAADALATALSVLGPDEGSEFFRRCGADVFPGGVDALLFVVAGDGGLKTVHLGVDENGGMVVEER